MALLLKLVIAQQMFHGTEGMLAANGLPHVLVGSFGSHKTLVESPTEATNVLELLTLHNKALFPVDLPWIQTIPKTPLGNTGKKTTQTCLHHLIFPSFHAGVLECPTL